MLVEIFFVRRISPESLRIPVGINIQVVPEYPDFSPMLVSRIVKVIVAPVKI
jgi:hypothetical protein